MDPAPSTSLRHSEGNRCVHQRDRSGAELRVVVVDDHQGYRRALGSVLELSPGVRLAGVAASVAEARVAVPDSSADVALVDINLGDGSGIELARELVDANPALRVLLISTMSEGDLPADMSGCGAVGFVRKDRFGPLVFGDFLVATATESGRRAEFWILSSSDEG